MLAGDPGAERAIRHAVDDAGDEWSRTVRVHKLPTLTRWHAWLPVASRHQKYTRGRISTGCCSNPNLIQSS
jgi:hypothetical protein